MTDGNNKHFMEVNDNAAPTTESMEAARESATSEERPCDICGDPVSIGERLAVLTEDGEVWRHPRHETE